MICNDLKQILYNLEYKIKLMNIEHFWWFLCKYMYTQLHCWLAIHNEILYAPPPLPYYLSYVGHNNYLLSHNRPIYLLIDLLGFNSNFNIISSILWCPTVPSTKNSPVTKIYNRESQKSHFKNCMSSKMKPVLSIFTTSPVHQIY